MCVINNSPPRLTWDEAQAVLEKHVHSIVAKNDEVVKSAVSICRQERRDFGESSSVMTKEWIESAKSSRAQSRELLAALNTMMRGV